jgi:16S rRNA C967 or C1407 C5-methylase (RsmB/RsmF family)
LPSFSRATFRLPAHRQKLRRDTYSWQLLPHVHGTDGAFAAQLQRAQ